MDDIDPLGADADRLFAEQLARNATAGFDMGKTRDHVRQQSVAFWEDVNAPAGMFAMAAESLSRLSQPPSESVERAERSRRSRERLGFASVESQLLSMMAARELLEQLAREFG